MEAPPERIRVVVNGEIHVLSFWGSDCNAERCGGNVSSGSWMCDSCDAFATPLYRFETNPW